MKLLPSAVMAGVFIFFASCGTVDNAKRYPHMVADADPISVGTIEVQFDRAFSPKLNKVETEVVFYPRLNAVALEFRYELIRHRQFWDSLARQQFASALELYKADYAEKKLSNRYRKTRAAYGKAMGQSEWETFRFSKTYRAYPVIELGYRFKDGSPFFTTLMRSAKVEDDNGTDSQTADSQQINMYFTRAQADALVALFDQSFLMGLVGERGVLKSNEPVVPDSYKEWDDD